MNNCPSEEVLAGFVDGTITGAEREAVESHLTACETCRVEVREIADLVASSASGPGAPVGLSDRIIAVRNRKKEGTRVSVRHVAVAAVMLMAVGAFWLAIPGGVRDVRDPGNQNDQTL